MKIAEWHEQHPRDLSIVFPDWSLETALDHMLTTSGLRDLYVVAPDGKLIGHISHQKLACALLSEHRPEHTRRQLMEHISSGNVDEIMNSHFVSATPDEELSDILHRLLDHNIEDMPILDDAGKPIGAINLTQILGHFRQLGETNPE